MGRGGGIDEVKGVCESKKGGEEVGGNGKCVSGCVKVREGGVWASRKKTIPLPCRTETMRRTNHGEEVGKRKKEPSQQLKPSSCRKKEVKARGGQRAVRFSLCSVARHAVPCMSMSISIIRGSSPLEP